MSRNVRRVCSVVRIGRSSVVRHLTSPPSMYSNTACGGRGTGETCQPFEVARDAKGRERERRDGPRKMYFDEAASMTSRRRTTFGCRSFLRIAISFLSLAGKQQQQAQQHVSLRGPSDGRGRYATMPCAGRTHLFSFCSWADSARPPPPAVDENAASFFLALRLMILIACGAGTGEAGRGARVSMGCAMGYAREGGRAQRDQRKGCGREHREGYMRATLLRGAVRRQTPPRRQGRPSARLRPRRRGASA